MPSPNFAPGAKFGIRGFQGDTNISDLDVASQAMRDDIEAKMLGYLEGTHGARPAASISNRVYKETDTGLYLFDTGAVWTPIGQLVPSLPPGNATAAAGQYVLAASGATITLPAASLGAVIAVELSRLATSAATIQTTSSQSIFGVGVSASSVKLGTPASFAVFMSMDGASWSIVGGQQDSGWVALTAATNYSTSLFNGGAETTGARLVGNRVYLRGGVSDTVGGNVGWNQIATIPSGLRPSASVSAAACAVAWNGGASGGSLTSGLVFITSAGAVYFAGTTGVNYAVMLDGINYSTS